MDFYADPSRGTLHLAKQVVKAVDLEKVAGEAAGGTDALAASAFADPTARLYPVHSAADVILSAAYAHTNAKVAGEIPKEVLKRIDGAAVLWGVSKEVEKLAAEINTGIVEETTKFALDLEIGGQHVQSFPYGDNETLKASAEAFYTQRHKLPWAARSKVAKVLFDELAVAGVKISEDASIYIGKAAGIGTPDMESADCMVATRGGRRLLDKTELQKLAAVIRLAEGEPDWAKYAMEAFDAFDEARGLKSSYGVTLRLPEEDLFINDSPYLKLAEDDGIVQLTNGKAVRLSSIDWAKVAAVDPGLYAETDKGNLEKAAEVLPTWPRPDADLLVEMQALQPV